MRVAVVTGPGSVELRENAGPKAGAEDVVVEIGACGLCTMERRLFAGEKKIYPVAPGHEAAGRVVDVGSEVATQGGPALGDLVTLDLLTRCGRCRPCRRERSALCSAPQGGALPDGTISMGAGLSEIVAVPARRAWSVGEAPIEHAAMGEPLACVAHSLRRSGLLAGDRVAVVGGGYMGRLHQSLARLAGAESTGVIDVSEERREDAAAAGASWTAAPEDALGVGGRQDVVFVTAGAPGVFERALDLCADGGTAVLYGAFGKDLTASVAPDAIHHHELSVIGVYSHEPIDWRTSAGIISSGSLARDLDALVTARFTLEDVLKAFELAARTPVYRVLVGGS